MRHRVERGGHRRPVPIPRAIRAAGLATLVLVWALTAPTAAAHGGSPVLQLGQARIQPGGTLEVLADMTGQGWYEVTLAAPAGARSWVLGSFEADYQGHVRVFLTIPVDVPPASYRIVARSGSEEATAPLEVAGTPIEAQVGQPLGQDEARAPVPTDPGRAVSTTGAGLTSPDVSGTAAALAPAVLALVLALAAAVVIGGLARSRRRGTVAHQVAQGRSTGC